MVLFVEFSAINGGNQPQHVERNFTDVDTFILFVFLPLFISFFVCFFVSARLFTIFITAAQWVFYKNSKINSLQGGPKKYTTIQYHH